MHTWAEILTMEEDTLNRRLEQVAGRAWSPDPWGRVRWICQQAQEEHNDVE